MVGAGLLRDKCIALIKGLPKALRKQLVPAPDVVDAALAELSAEDSDLCAALSGVLKRQRGVQVGPSDWQPAQLEDFYRMNIRVVDAEGKLLGAGPGYGGFGRGVSRRRAGGGRPTGRLARAKKCRALGLW